ncbi:NlpC/P60 family protein [Streptomyces sp. NPDC102406]|uniref:NlpC/P60 family protein n=1 Tax=Streptomyces sp. NPDC102406 TaxID=3366171 RepID=UPI0038118BED
MDDHMPYQQPPAALTTTVLAGPPQQLRVSDAVGTLATLTVGAKTVTVRGQTRTMTEQKRPWTDPFARTVSGGWGQSPGGGTWLNLSGSDTNFAVNGSQGVILNDAANTGRYVSVNDGDLADVSATCKVTVSATPAGAASSVGMTFGYTDSSNHYRARLLLNTTGTVQLALEKVATGTTTTLGTATTLGTGFAANQWWRIRVQRAGSTIRCRAWLDGNTEPGAWTFSVTDTTFPAGRVGLRSFASTGSTVVPFNTLVDDFTVDSAVWASPPTVIHNTWVRVLPAPFNGTWTGALADQIRAWAVDTTPDALGYATMFITGAPTVTSPALSGKQVYGQAQYGPLNADGTRIEFSDWNDYIGIPWTYPNGETRSFPHGLITISGCLDCSGFVRMVFGRNMGIPMSFDSNYDGLNLPRRSADMGPSGPGVLIANSAGSPPATTNLQVGDYLGFALSDSTDGELTHSGIYLGLDTAGNQRFISARKVANGPTMSDLGGASILNGTGTYSTGLRTIRRF